MSGRARLSCIAIAFGSSFIMLGCRASMPLPAHQNTAALGASQARISIPVEGYWQFRRTPVSGGQADARGAGADAWMPAVVPGCVHTDLLANGKIRDPFDGQNEKDQQWIDEQGWEYRTSFDVGPSALAREHVDLVWKGLDTYADVFLNGTRILSADNMFREWRVDAKSRLRQGENELVVRFRSPIKEVAAAYDGLGYTLPASNDQSTRMVSMFTRKAPYQYGWDWGPRFVTSGIWRPVLLEAWNDARIDDVQIVQNALTDERADLRVRVAVVASRPGRARVSIGLAGGASLGQVEAAVGAGRNVVEASVAIDHPERWWPNGLGKARLYTIDAALAMDGAAVDARSTRIGLRTLEVVHQRDADGKSFTIRVNGAPVFMKGANYIPSDSFPSRVSTERYRGLVQSAADANMNMLRVWGGGIYEDDRFYALCDELGILVWQDFMFACSMYPGDEAFIANVKEEAVENVRRLRNHPSLALWSGNNEIEAAWKKWGWQVKFQLSDEAQDKIWGAYKRVFHELLPKVVADEDPGRFYTRSSPSANDDDIAPDTIGFGDMHYWGVWHAEQPYSKYSENVSRFMSEYGFQSFPELATVASYARPEDWRIDSPVMLAHQRHPRGNQLIRTYMERDFRTPKDFPSFLYASQVLQATIIQYAAEAHRRRWPYNAGSLYWQLDDCWPVASWSGIDYFGRWKALHYHAKRFFAPTLVSVVEEEGALRTYVVSDRREAAAGRLVQRVVDFDGRELWRTEAEVRIEPNTSKVYATVAPGDALAGGDLHRSVFVAELFEGARSVGRTLHYFVPTKDLDLPDPEVSLEVVERSAKGATLRVASRKLAREVRLTTSSDGRFSDDYFDMLPGDVFAVEWRGAAEAHFEATSIRDTY
jgi:beta-mannosidase